MSYLLMYTNLTSQRGSPPRVLSESASCNTVALLWNCIVSKQSCSMTQYKILVKDLWYARNLCYLITKDTALNGFIVNYASVLHIYLFLTISRWRFGAIDPFSAGETDGHGFLLSSMAFAISMTFVWKHFNMLSYITTNNSFAFQK